MILDPYRFAADPLFANVVLLVGANETAGTIPQDLSLNAISPSGTLTTAADASAFTGVALSWTPTDSYLSYTKVGGFLPNDSDDYCLEVWGDLASITGGNASYVNPRNVFARAYDSVLTGNAGVFSGCGTSDTQVAFSGGAGGATGFAVNLLSGGFSGLGLTRFSRMHWCVQRESGTMYYYINGRAAGNETTTADRNPDVVYFGNVGDGSGFESTGTAEWLRLTVGLRYPTTPTSTGTYVFDVPTGPFPTR